MRCAPFPALGSLQYSARVLSNRSALLASLGIAILAPVLCWLGAGDRALGFPLDDAWILMVYGRSLAETGVLAYNPDGFAAGCTAPLWAALLAIPHLIFGAGRGAVVGAYALALLAHLGATAFAADYIRRRTEEPWATFTTGLAVGAAPLLCLGVFSGMEVSLCAALLLGALWASEQRRVGLAATLAALACLTRPEATVATLVLLVALWPELRARGAKTALWSVSPLAIGGVVAVGLNLLSSGRPLPATFYLKQESSLLELPARLWVGANEILFQSAPLYLGLPMLLLVGIAYAPKPRGRDVLPLAMGLGFLLANLYTMSPSDPYAFYHQRYLLPAVPLLVVAIVVATHRIARGPLAGRSIPLMHILASFTLLTVALTLPAASSKLHSDIRSINSVQVPMGSWLEEHTEPGEWIAASDAGAVRYFSDRPTLDLMGLNTPELYWDAPSYAADRPVRYVALMPAWLAAEDPDDIRIVTRFAADDYHVTSDPRMAFQGVIVCRSRQLLRLRGRESVDLICYPPDADAGAP